MATSSQADVEPKQRLTLLALGAVVLAAAVAYLPVFDDFFISDDFVYITQIRMALANPAHLLHIPPGFYRLTGHLYFLLCYALFGLHPAGYHAVGVLVHASVCLLVYLLAGRLSGDRAAGIAAALFFAVYERHHEAVLWISAASEITATAAIIAGVLFWERFLHASRRRAAWYAPAMLAFGVSLLSKESSVVAVALLLATDVAANFSSPRASATGTRSRAPADGEQQFAARAASGVLRKLLAYAPAVVVSLAYLRLVSASDPLVRKGFYAVGTHALRVYAKTLNTLLIFVALAVIAWLLTRGWRAFAGVLASHRVAFIFFGAWLLVTPIPFCFATYVGQLPSRQTYLQSVATAALVGLLAVELLRSAGRLRVSMAVLCLLVLAGNTAYVWKKDRQFEKRATPTRLLVDTLRTSPGGAGKVYIISGSEYYNVVSRAAVELFTLRANDLLFVTPPEARALRPAAGDFVMQWDERQEVLRVLRKPD